SLYSLPRDKGAEFVARAIEGAPASPVADFLKGLASLDLSGHARDSLAQGTYYGLNQLQQAYASDQSLPAVLHLADGLARQLPIDDQEKVVRLAVEQALTQQPEAEVEQLLVSLRGLLDLANPGQQLALLDGAISCFATRGKLDGTSVATAVLKAALPHLDRARLSQAIDALPGDDNPAQKQLIAFGHEVIAHSETPDSAYSALTYGLARLDGAKVGPALAAAGGSLGYIPSTARVDLTRKLAELMVASPATPEDAALGAYLSQVADFENPERLQTVLTNVANSWAQQKTRPPAFPPALLACHGGVYCGTPEVVLQHLKAVPVSESDHPVARFLAAVAQSDGLEQQTNLAYGVRGALESLATPAPDGLSPVVMAASQLVTYLSPENQAKALKLALPLAVADQPDSADLMALLADWTELGATPNQFLPACLNGYKQQVEKNCPLPPALMLARDGLPYNGTAPPTEWVAKVMARVPNQGLAAPMAQGVEYLRQLATLPAVENDYRTAAFQRAITTLAGKDPLPAAAALLRETLPYTPEPNKTGALRAAIASLRNHSDGPDSQALADFIELQLQLNETTAERRVTQAFGFWEVRQKFSGLPASLALCSAASQEAFSPEQAKAMLERFLPAQDPADPEAAQVVRFLRALDPSNTSQLRSAFSAMRWVANPTQSRLPAGLLLCHQMLSSDPAAALHAGLASLAPGQAEPLAQLLELFQGEPSIPATNLQAALAAYNDPAQPASSPHLLRAGSNLVGLRPRPVTEVVAKGLGGPLGGFLQRLAAGPMADDKLAKAVVGMSSHLTRLKQDATPASQLIQAAQGVLSYLDQSQEQAVYEAVEAELRSTGSQVATQVADWLQKMRADHSGPWLLQAAADACNHPLNELMPFKLLIGDAALTHHGDEGLAREVLAGLNRSGRDALFMPTARLNLENPVAEVHRLRAEYEQWLKKNPQLKPEKVELEQQEDWVSVGDFGIAIQD
ncbi:MAG: hypothetical protein KC910_24310, partial [Candidatus Eremiobacteraeota bacterium]|nr:hypothetical protein [Candidatus Eremiobacteraeota bacterium]